MTRKYRILATLLCLLLLFTGCSGNTDTPGSSENSGGNIDTSFVTSPPAPDVSSSRPTRPVTTTVTLADGDIKTEGAGASASGNTLTIATDGVYEVSGTLLTGRLLSMRPIRLSWNWYCQV